MTPAKSTDGLASSSRWITYSVPMSDSVSETLTSRAVEAITCAPIPQKALIAAINTLGPMAGSSRIEGARIEADAGERPAATVSFSVAGGIREAFGEGAWERAYDAHDNLFKVRYGVRLRSGRRALGREVDSYRKAAIFWTRNPKLVNPMKDRRIWVQVSRNFEPVVPLTVEGVRAALFDFEERIPFDPAALGEGTHGLAADVWASWQKHEYAGAESHSATAAGSVTIGI